MLKYRCKQCCWSVYQHCMQDGLLHTHGEQSKRVLFTNFIKALHCSVLREFFYVFVVKITQGYYNCIQVWEGKAFLNWCTAVGGRGSCPVCQQSIMVKSALAWKCSPIVLSTDQMLSAASRMGLRSERSPKRQKWSFPVREKLDAAHSCYIAY